MRTIASIGRTAAALILLALVSFHGREICADTATATESGSPMRTVTTAVIAETEKSDAEQKDPSQNGVGQKDPGLTPDSIDYFELRDDDAWLINTRHLECLTGKSEFADDLEVLRYSEAGDWVAAGLSELLASDPRLTVIYVHGNRVSYDDAITRAREAFRVLQMDPSAPPMRLIIWSWPSDRIQGQIRDVRYKAARTNIEGQYLGWFLAQIDPETSINLIGFSYGARVVTGAMHVLSGGMLACQSTPRQMASVDRRPIQVVLVAAALHNHWLSSGGYHDGFWRFANRLLLLYNSCDPVLKRYRFVEKWGRPVALGYSGTWGLDDDRAARTEQHDVCCSVGKTHSESAFFSSTEVIEGVQQHLLTTGRP